MNYYVLLASVLLALFLIYTPGIITLSFSKLNSVIQITFIPFNQWNSSAEDIKGSNWFGAFRVLGGKAMKYSKDGSTIEETHESIDYLIRILGFEFEYIVIKKNDVSSF